MRSLTRLFGDDGKKPLSELQVIRPCLSLHIVSRWYRLVPLQFLMACILATSGRRQFISVSELFFVGNFFHLKEDSTISMTKHCNMVG